MRKQSRLGSGLAVLLSAGLFGAGHVPSPLHRDHHAGALPRVRLASAVIPLPTDPTTTTSTSTTSTTAPPTTTSTTSTSTTSTTAAPPPKKSQSQQASAAPSDDVWAKLRTCESHGNYADNTGNGYYGAYQFSARTWHSLGYTGLPHTAQPSQQDEAAKRLQARGGWRQWPACARQLGLH